MDGGIPVRADGRDDRRVDGVERGDPPGAPHLRDFAPAWRDRTVEEDPGAPFFNQTKKYVVSSNPLSEEWSNAKLLGAYDPKAIEELKERTDGNIYVSGSGMLVRGMLADGLVDELHLFVFPLTLGAGDRLFEEGGTPETKLKLAASDIYDSGVAHLAYGPAA